MKRLLPLWIAAVVPATLAGHALAYALSGRSTADGHHAWVAPTLEYSLIVLGALCFALAGGALVRAGILVATERHAIELFARLAVLQIALFAAMEHAEGAGVNLTGCLAQIATAILAAYLLSLFSRLIVRCAAQAAEASRYLERLLDAAALFVPARPLRTAHALAVLTGTARFQRPPPLR